MTQQLSEKRAADRKKMAEIVSKIIVDCGATFESPEGPGFCGPHEIFLEITAPGGLNLTVDFDGQSCQPDVHVLSWHMNNSRSTKRLNNSTFGGNVNQFHFHKATYVAYGFDDLCAQLRKGLLMAKDGSAYLPDLVAA